jgi:signal transduction histidine kinase
MTMSDETAKLLRQALRRRSRAELKRLFAAIRAHDDRTLLSAIAPPRKRAAKRAVDPLVRDLERTLRPILGPVSEKAELLVEHLARKRRRKLAIAPKGLADAVRQLRAKDFSDDEIRAGARSLMTRLAKLYGGQENVV